MDIHEPNPRGLIQPIPTGRTIIFSAAGRETTLKIDGHDRFAVVDRTLGRVALRSGTSYVSVSRTSDSTSTVRLRAGAPGENETFQWMETMYGDIMLMSLATNRYLFLAANGQVTASSRGPEPDPADGTALRWRTAR
jgi:xylan 1,4-beta-xylosidase